MPIVRCYKADYPALVAIWERSVRATHDFLTEDVIKEIREALVPDYFPNVELYAVDENGSYIGFVGISGNKIEMLFIDSDRLGKGYGSMLVDFASRRGATMVDVNEHNPSALKFYLAKGFRVIRREDTDEAGRPYPLLHLTLDK